MAERVKVFKGDNPPPAEIRDDPNAEVVVWDSPGGKLKYDKRKGTYSAISDAEVKRLETPPAAQPAPSAGVGAGATRSAFALNRGAGADLNEAIAEKKRAETEAGVQAAQTQQAIGSRGALGGLGIADRARVNTWLRQNKGKTEADAIVALGIRRPTAGAQAEALK